MQRYGRTRPRVQLGAVVHVHQPPKDWWDAGDLFLPIRSVPRRVPCRSLCLQIPGQGGREREPGSVHLGMELQWGKQLLEDLGCFPTEVFFLRKDAAFYFFLTKNFLPSLSNSSLEGMVVIRNAHTFYLSSYSVELCLGAFKHGVEKVLITGTFPILGCL